MKKITNKKEESKIERVIPEGTEHIIECEDKVCYLRKLDKKTLKSVFPFIFSTEEGKDPDFLSAGEMVLRNLFIGGDIEFLNDDDFVFAGALQCASLIKFKAAILKKN